MHTLIIVAVAVSAYAVFWAWYVGFRGPLTKDEIEAHVAKLSDYDPERVAVVRAFLEADTGREFLMQNEVLLRSAPAEGDAWAPGETARAILERYSQPFLAALLRRGGHPMYAGRSVAPALERWNVEGVERWTMSALVRYRSRRDMIELVTDPAFAGMHTFKERAVEKTFAHPVHPFLFVGGPKLLVAMLLIIAVLIAELALA